MKNRWNSVKGLTFIAFMLIIIGLFSFSNYPSVGKVVIFVGALLAAIAVFAAWKVNG